MKLVVVGCGRVGSAVARSRAEAGWEVVVLDKDEDALSGLGAGWRGGFVVGHALDIGALENAGVENADAALVATGGDNTNLVVGQVLQRRYGVANVIVRVLDPARAEFFASLGLRTVCPTQTAIADVTGVLEGLAGRGS